MSKESSISSIARMVLFVVSPLYTTYSFIGDFYDLPNLGEIDSMTGVFIGFWIFVFVVAWQFLEMNREIKVLRDKFPRVLFGEPKCVEIGVEQVHYFGEKSLIGAFASHKRIHLFCIDFFNKPVIPNGSNAEGAQVIVEFYDEDGNREKGYLGRWIEKPENGFGIKRGSTPVKRGGVKGL